jgi:hypothetical protein
MTTAAIALAGVDHCKMRSKELLAIVVYLTAHTGYAFCIP